MSPVIFHKIKSVRCLPDFKLLVRFEENIYKVYSIKKLCEANSTFTMLLNDPDLFNYVNVDIGGYGVFWNDDLDISCNELWNNGELL